MLPRAAVKVSPLFPTEVEISAEILLGIRKFDFGSQAATCSYIFPQVCAQENHEKLLQAQKSDLLFYFLQTAHSKQANRALKRKELLFFTDRSLQASQQGTKTQGVTFFTDSSLQASQQGTKTQGVTVFYRQVTPSKRTGH